MERPPYEDDPEDLLDCNEIGIPEIVEEVKEAADGASDLVG